MIFHRFIAHSDREGISDKQVASVRIRSAGAWTKRPPTLNDPIKVLKGNDFRRFSFLILRSFLCIIRSSPFSLFLVSWCPRFPDFRFPDSPTLYHTDPRQRKPRGQCGEIALAPGLMFVSYDRIRRINPPISAADHGRPEIFSNTSKISLPRFTSTGMTSSTSWRSLSSFISLVFRIS